MRHDGADFSNRRIANRLATVMKRSLKNFSGTAKLGLDFGKVILGAVRDGKADTSFLGTSFDQAMQTPASDGAVEAVTELVDAFYGNVWIVSKCGPSVERKTRGWLDRHDFYGVTGLNPQNVRFCRKRPEKAPICQEIGITHFVDDRIDVLTPMQGIVARLYLFGEQEPGFQCPAYATPVLSWSEVLAEILGDPAP